MTEMSATQVRADWAQVLRTARSGKPVTVTQHGEATAVVVEIGMWHRACHALEDAEDVMAHDAAVSAGDLSETVSWEDVKAKLRAEVSAEVLAEVRHELGLV
jgi:prevent-host-death family protein